MKEKDCIFCMLANGDIPTATLYEDEDFRVILDQGPANPGHALILPKNHYRDLTELEETVAAKALPLASRVGKRMMEVLGCDGFNVVQNNGKAAGQTVFHFHIHVIPRYESDGKMVEWKPGSYAEGETEAMAEKLKF